MSEDKEIKLVYLGVVASFNKAPKKYYAYIELEKLQAYLSPVNVFKIDLDEIKYYKRILARVSIGAIILCKVTVDTDRFTIHGVPEFVEKIDFQTRMLLEAKSNAAQVNYEVEVERRKAVNESALEKQLAPVKDTYSHMKTSERRAFIAWLLVYLNA